jgi:hypothetical protein
MELNEARLRMATLPAPADEVLFTPGMWVPLVVVDRVYVLPGIPRLFQAMVSAHQVRTWCCLHELASAWQSAWQRFQVARPCKAVRDHAAFEADRSSPRIAACNPTSTTCRSGFRAP